MKLIHSDMLPLSLPEGGISIADCFMEQAKKADKIDVAVGYVSKASLTELDRIVRENEIREVRLIIGMYYLEGMPEASYHTACAINEKWKEDGIGEIRLVRPLKYHGKIYCFYKDGKPLSAIVGSANLGVLKLEASNRRQFETCLFTEDADESREIADLIDRLADDRCSADISNVTGMRFIREVNASLNNVENVDHLPQSEVDLYRRHATDVSFGLLLKVPKYSERMLDDNRHYTKSNLNTCYSSPRPNQDKRDWYETQITVSVTVTRREGYPKNKVPFYVITDDGYWFKAHTTSSSNKQFAAVGNELIMGRWIKGRLAAAGLVEPVNNTKEDVERKGSITQEMLDAYGCDTIVFTKTDLKKVDEEGIERDIWIFSFESSKKEADE